MLACLWHSILQRLYNRILEGYGYDENTFQQFLYRNFKICENRVVRLCGNIYDFFHT